MWGTGQCGEKAAIFKKNFTSVFVSERELCTQQEMGLIRCSLKPQQGRVPGDPGGRWGDKHPPRVPAEEAVPAKARLKQGRGTGCCDTEGEHTQQGPEGHSLLGCEPSLQRVTTP